MDNDESTMEIKYKVDFTSSYEENTTDYLIGKYENGILVDSKAYRLPEDKDIDEFIKELKK